MNIRLNYYIRSQLTKSRKRAIICYYYSHRINDWKFTKVTKINRQLIRPSRKYPSYHELRSPTCQLYFLARGSFLLKFFHFHSLLCLIVVQMTTGSVLSFRTLLNNGKFLFPHQKLDNSLVSTFEGQKFLTIKRYFSLLHSRF